MRPILFFLPLITATPTMAQTDLHTDSVRRLKEITVNGVRIRQKVDHQLLFPSKTIVEHASDGYELLKRLSLDGILVNTAEQKITSLRGGGIQIRINDIIADKNDIQALRPDEVVRVEFIDHPGVRYSDSGLDAVINYVVKRRYAGYVGGVSTLQAFYEKFNNSNAYFKYNHRKSEFSLNYNFSLRDYDQQTTRSRSTYYFPDGTERYRNYIGYNNDMMYNDHILQLGYNLAEVDKYVLNIHLKYNWFNSPYRGPIQRVEETGQADHLLYSHYPSFSKTPILDIYYSVDLPKEQNITANVVGTYIGTNYSYNMHEYIFDQSLEKTLQSKPIHDYSYSTDGKKYSLIGEAIYTKRLKDIVLSAGANYAVSHTNNKYTGSVNTDAVLNSNNLYAFTQIQGKLGFLNYLAGIGANYSSIRQGEIGFNRWTFRPQLTLSANVNKHLTLYYTGRISPNTPSLSDLSDVSQRSNDMEANNGNMNLKPYNGYSNSMNVIFNYPFFRLNLYGSIYTSPKIIMSSGIPEKQKDGSWLLTWVPENQKRYTKYYYHTDLTLHLIKDKLDLILFNNLSHYETRGNDYAHDYTYCQVGGRISLMLGRWSMDYSLSTVDKSLFAESINGGENSSNLNISYKYKNLQVGIGCILLGYARGYDYTNEVNSRYYKSESHTTIKNNGNMLYFNLSYNFSHGRKYQTANRKLYNSDTESGVK